MAKKRALPKVGELVMVQWLDAAGYAGWQEDDGGRYTGAPVASVGWVVQVDELIVALSPHTALDDNSIEPHGDVMAIPKGMVMRWQVIK
jgi:hypothetical protein